MWPFLDLTKYAVSKIGDFRDALRPLEFMYPEAKDLVINVIDPLDDEDPYFLVKIPNTLFAYVPTRFYGIEVRTENLVLVEDVELNLDDILQLDLDFDLGGG